ncbi:MAG: hypothetical protein GX963_14130 [Bacteroidales bacterium]|nr:hypothetical protein [Bacteroidales bacterium]
MKTHILLIITFIPILLVGQNNGDRFIQQGHPYDLLGGSINTITQDNWGFLWFGTDNGLSRFDGYNFKRLHNKDKSNKNIPLKNYIKKVFLDSDNRLWIGMHKGLSIYDDATYDLRNVSEFDNLYINSLKEDANKNIWVATHNGIYILSKDSKEIYHIGAQNSSELDNKKVNFIVPDQHNNFWAFSEYGIHKIWITDQNNIKTSFSFTDKCKINISSYPIKGRIGFFVIDKENNAYFSVDNTIYTISLENDAFNLNDASIVAQGEEYLCAHMDSYNNLWVGTRYRGITLFNKKTAKKITQKKYWISPNRYYDITNTVTTLYEDNLGNIWVGTPKELFAMKRNNTQNFSSIREGEDSNSLTNRIVTGLIEDENKNIWITTSYGLNKLSWLNKDKKGVHIDHYINDRSKDQNFASNNSLQSLIAKDQNTLWISTKKNILSYNIKNEQFFEDEQLSDFLKDNNMRMARCFFKDKKNNIWIGFEFGGICVFLADKNEFIRLGTIDKTFDDGDYWAITKDARDYMWIGSKRKGLFKIKINMDSLGMTKNPISYKKQFLPTKWITSVFINKDNIAWVGTSNEAYHYSSAIDDFEELKMIGPSNQSTYISGIVEDQNDAIWFSSTTGIFKYDENKQLTQAYNTNEYDFAKINYQFSTYCSHDGTIYMGGINGLTYFSPNLLQTDTIKQKILISDFKVLNQPFSLKGEKNINLTRLVHLSYKENQFTFEFSTLYLTDPYKIKYRYKLEGLDKDWIYVDTNRNHASYSNLAPGHYKFCVQSTTRSGEWTDNQNVIEVIIAPPFWATWWAYCIYVLILILIIIFIIYLNYVKGIYGQQKKYNQWKTELYTDIINSFDTPLFLLKAPLENMIGNLHNIGESEIEELLKIMNQNVKRLRHLVKHIIPPFNWTVFS